MSTATSTKTLATKKGLIAAIVALLLAVGGGVFAASQTSRAYAADMKWSELSANASAGTRIQFAGKSGGGQYTDGAETFDRYSTLPVSFTLPTQDDIGVPTNYKGQDDQPNFELKGWYIVPDSATYEEGTQYDASKIRHFAPGDEVTLTEADVNTATGTIHFYAEWGVRDYNFGSANDTGDGAPLGGLRDDIVPTDSIRTYLYDIDGETFNALNTKMDRDGDYWSSNKSGIRFIDGELNAWNNMADGFGADMIGDSALNQWTGRGGAAAPGLWKYVEAAQIFNGENTDAPGVTYVGDANSGAMYWLEEKGDGFYGDRFKGYYVYTSEDSAAVYNQDEHKFYVYNQPQKMHSDGNSNATAFLPFNKPVDDGASAYTYRNGAVNYHFGMVTEIDFFLTGQVPTDGQDHGTNKIDGDDMVFYFSGDDDVFVFVDGELALDLGGIHSRTEGEINFAKGTISYKQTKGTGGASTTTEVTDASAIAGLEGGTHRMTVYYMERGGNESNNLTAFRLTLPATIQIQKLETQTGEPAVFPGTQFFLQNTEGEYYCLETGVDPNDPLRVPKVTWKTFNSEAERDAEATRFEADEDGIITMKYIPDGDYVLTEIGAPDYYEGLPGAFKFTVGNAEIEDGSLEFNADNNYVGGTDHFTSDSDWADKIEIADDKVTLEVSNDRSTKPLKMTKQTDDNKPLPGVKFNIYELPKAPTTTDSNGNTVIDTDLIDTDTVPTEVRHVYEGTTNSDGIVTDYTWYPRGKNLTPASMVVEHLENADLKEGAVYYIVEDYFDEDLYKFDKPIVLTVDGDNIILLSDPDNVRFKFEGVKVLNWTDATDTDPAELDVTNVTVTTEDPVKKVNGNDQQKDKVDENGQIVYKPKKDKDGNVITNPETGEVVYYLDTAGNKVAERERDDTQVEELAARDSVFTYTITQKVPANTTKMTITDKLEDVLQIVGTPTIAPNSYGVFKVTVDEATNTVTATGDDASINGADPIAGMAANGVEVTLTIRARIKDGITDAQLKQLYGGTTDIPNTAIIKINDDPEVTTNEVKVTPPPEIENPRKSIEESTAPDKDELKLVDRREDFTYVIEQEIPARTKSITVEDTLENVLEFVGNKSDVKIYLVDSENNKTELTTSDETVQVTQTSSKLTVNISDAAATSAGNKTLRVEFKAQIKEGISDEQLLKLYRDENEDPTTSIPNKASVTIDNKLKVTNEVEVTPPPTPEKRVDNDVHKVLDNANDTFSYEVKQFVPKDATKVSFSDELSGLLDFEGTYIIEVEDPLTGNKTALTDGNGTVDAKAEKIEFDLSAAQLAEVQGKIVVVSFKAKIDPGSVLDVNGNISDTKLEEIKAHQTWGNVDDNGTVSSTIGDHEGIKNAAKVTVDPYNNGKFSNEVTVTPPTTEPGGLDVLKNLETLEEDSKVDPATKEFTFTVEFTTDSTIVLPETLSIVKQAQDATEDAEPGNINVVDGKITFTLKGGEVAKINGLPHGTTYKVTEAADDAFDTNIASGDGKIVSGVSRETTVTNREKEPPAPGALDILKIVNGDAEDATFTFNVALDKAQGADDINYDKIKVAIDDGEANAATVTEDGKITVTIKKGETAHITGIPTGTAYQVEEIKTDGYQIETKLADAGTITTNNTSTAVFINAPEPQDDPVKEVGAAQDNTSTNKLKLANRQQEYFYAISQKVPSYATRLVFEDTLATVLTFAGDPEVKLNDEAVTAVAAADYDPENEPEADVFYVIDGQRLIVVVKGDKAKELRSTDANESIAKVTFKAQLKANITDEQLIAQYGSTDIPNTATVTINNKPGTSNQVEVTPPPESQKTIRGDVHAVLANADETFYYAITTFVPTDAGSVVVADSLSGFLVIDRADASDAISVTADGNPVSRAAYRETKDQTGFTIEFIDLGEVKGKTLVVSFNATFDPILLDSNGELTPAALERIEAAYGTVTAEENAPVATATGEHEGIINEATVTIDGNDNPTNKVTVIPPTNDPGTLVVKKTLLPNSKEELTAEDRETEFEFTVTLATSEDAKLAEDILDGVTVTKGGTVLSNAIDKSASTISFTLKGDEEVKIEGLPGGTKYQVVETLDEESGFEQVPVADSVVNSSIVATIEKTVEIQNKKEEPPAPGTLSLLKAVSGEVPSGEENREFTFEVELFDENDTPLNPLRIEGLLINGRPVENADVDAGKIVVKLKANEQVDISGIPAGTKYVAEENTEGLVTFELDTDNKVNWEGTIGDGATITSVFINKPVTPPSDPVKAINGTDHVDLGAKDAPFTYTVTQFIPIGTKSVSFEDVLNGELRFAGNARVTGGNLLKNLTVDANSSTLSFELTPEEIAQVEGYIMTVTFQAKYKETATDTSIEESYVDVTEEDGTVHTGTPNEATTKVGDHEATTNVVTVTAPPDIETPQKGFNAEGKLVDYERDENGEYVVDQGGNYIEIEPKKQLNGRNETFTYYVEQAIPENLNVKSIEFSDTLEAVLEFAPQGTATANAKIQAVSYDQNDAMTVAEDLTDAFDIVISGQTITATPKAGVDLNDTFQGKTLRFSFDAKIKTGVTDEQLLNSYPSTNGAVPNTATVTINNSPIGTNETLVTTTPEDEDPEKTVNGVTDADATTPDFIDAVKLANRNETFTYTVTQKVPLSTDDDKVTSLVFSDTLKPELELVGENGGATLTYVVMSTDEDGNQTTEDKPIEGTFATSADGQTLTATIDNAELLQGDLQNQVVVLTFKARIKSTVTDEVLYSKYRDNTLDIPNEAQVTVKINDNGSAKTTNEVFVTPPPEQPEDPEKFVEGGKYGTPADQLKEGETAQPGYELAKRFSEVTYTVTQKVPALATSIQFIDQIERVLDIVKEGDASQVFLKDAQGNVIDEANIRVIGNLVMATLSDADKLAALTNQKVTLEIHAQLRAGVTDEDLIEAYGENREIPNEATVIIGDSSKTTNEVKVVPPEEPEDPEKLINGQKNLVTLADRDEVFTYTVSQLIPDNADKVEFKDLLETVLEVVTDDEGKPEVSVSGLATYAPTVDNVTDEAGNPRQEVVVTTEDATADRGETVTLTIKAKIKDDVDDQRLLDLYGSTIVDNKATVTIDDQPKVTNTVQVTPPTPPTEEPEKKIGMTEADQGTKTLNLALEDADGNEIDNARQQVFTYTVSQKVPANCLKLEFEDTLATFAENAAKAGQPVLVFANSATDAGATLKDEAGKAIPATITVDGQTITAVVTDSAALANLAPTTAEDGTVTEHTATLTFTARFADDVSDADIIAEYGVKQVPNKATVKINGNPSSTNEVKVTPPEKPGSNPIKDVNGSGVIVDETTGEPVLDADGNVQTVPVELENRTETFTYTVSQKLPALADVSGGHISKAVFEDKLESVLLYAGNATVTVDGEEITDLFDINATDPAAGRVTVTASFAAEEPENSALDAYAEKTLVFSFDAKLKPGTTDDQLIALYGSARTVDNVANVTINDDIRASNEVEVIPPEVDRKDPTKTEEGYDQDGNVIPATGETEDTVKLTNRKDTFTYTIAQEIPDGAATIQFDDVLERVLHTSEANVKLVVVNANGTETDISEADGVSISVRNDRIVAASIIGNDAQGVPYASAYSQATLALKITAQMNADVTDDQLIALYGDARTIPNEATVTIDNDGKPTNTVYTVPPEEPEDPEKQINGDTKQVTLADRDETFTYTVTQLIPENAKTVTLEDTVEPELIVTEGSAIVTVTKEDGSAATFEGQPVIEGKKVSFTLAGIQEAGLGKGTITLEFKASIDPDVDDAKLLARPSTQFEDVYENDYNGTTVVPNKATAKFDFEDSPRSTNTVEVTPPPTPSEEPEKTIGLTEDDQQKNKPLELKAEDADGNEIADPRHQTFTYQINQVIPAGCAKLEFEDALATLEDGRAAIVLVGANGNAKLTYVDDEGATKALAFDHAVTTDDITGAQSIYVAVNDAEALAGLAGKTVTLTFNAKLADVTDAELIGTFGTTQVPNKATVKINNDGKSTNEVKVTPPETPGEKPVKRINGDTGIIVDENTGEPILDENGNEQVVPVELANRTEQFEYSVSQQLPAVGENEAIDLVIFEDKLESVLQYVDGSAKIVRVGAGEVADEDVTDKFDITSDIVSGRQVVKATNKEAMTAYADSVLLLTFKAQLKPGTSDATLIALYGDTKEIPNVANVTIGEDIHATNEVKVVPPNTTRKDPTKDVDGIDENGEVIPMLGETEDSIKLANRKDAFTYTIAQEIPQGAVNVQFDDVLERVLEVVGTPKVVILNAEGAATKTLGADEATVTVRNNRIVNAQVADATAYADQTMALVVNARIKDDVTDAQLIALYGDERQIPNEATVTIDGEGVPTNEVKVTPPEEPEDPEKLINGQKELVTLADRDEVFTYTVKQLIPENAVKVEISDTIEDELIFVDEGGQAQKTADGEGAVSDNRSFNAGNVGVSSAQGGQISVNGKQIKVTIEDATALRGQEATLTFKAAIDPSVTDAQLLAREGGYSGTTVVPNTATVKFDFEDSPRSTNTVEVTPPPTPSDEPEKKVNGQDAIALEQAEGQELAAARAQKFTYTVSQKVPAGVARLEFADTLASVLELAGEPKVMNGEADVTDLFDITIPAAKVAERGTEYDTVTVTAVSKSDEDTLAKLADLADATLTLAFDAKIKDGVQNGVLIARYGTTSVPNQATVKINGNPNKTNTVTVTPPDGPGEKPEKTVNGAKAGTDQFAEQAPLQLANRTDSFTYKVSQKLPAELGSVKFEDTVESVLQIDESSARIEGSEDASKYAIKVEGQKITAEAADASADAGKTVTLVFDAKIKPGVTDAQLIAAYGVKVGDETQAQIPNTAIVAVDDTPRVTNEVKVTPPPTVVEEPKKEVTPDGEGIDVDGNHIEAKLANRAETFTYTVSQVIPAGAVNVQFTDALERVLEVVGEPTVMVGATPVNGAQVTVTPDKRVVMATVADASSYAGQTMVLTVKAQIKANVTDEQLIALYGDDRQIPNEATVTIDGKGQTTNEVVVTPPEEPKNPEKLINGQKERVALDARDEVFTYTVKQLVPGNAKTLAISDTLEKELEVVPGSAKMDVDGFTVKVDGQTVTAEIADATALRNKEVTLTFEAKIRADVTDAALLAREGAYAKTTIVPNVAEVKFGFEDSPRSTNTVEVTPPPTPSDEPEKKVGKDAASQSAETLQLANREDGYVYTVSQKIPAGAVNVVFEDTLEGVLAFDGVPRLTLSDGTVIAEGPDAGYFAVSGQTITATIADATAYADDTVTLAFGAVIREGVTDAQLIERYKSTQVPNKATVKINGNPKSTNEVRVMPPDTPGENPVKKVNGQDSLQLASRTTEFTYTVSQKVTDDATAVEFLDTVEDVLEIVADSADVEGNASYEIEVDGQTIKAITDDATADRGQTVTLSFKAKLRAGVTDERLVTLYGEAMDIPNLARVTIDDNPKVSNVVKVTPPPTDTPEPEKKINGQKEPVTLENRADEFVYTVSQVIPDGAVNVVFTDTLERVLQVVGDPSIDVEAEGATVEVTGQAQQTVTATIPDATALAGKTVTLTINAKIKDGVTDEQLITLYGDDRLVPNKATVTIDGKGQTTNEVQVTPPPEEPPAPEEPKIEKLVTTSKTAINNVHGELAAIDEVYTYTINTSMPANAKGFVVSDTIDAVLAFDGDATVTVDGKTAGEATVDGKTLTVTFTEDEVTANAGAPVQVVFNAKIAVTDEELVAAYADRTVPNTAQYVITDENGQALEPKPSNEVTVTPPTPEEPVGSVRVRYITEDGTVLENWSWVQENKPDATPYGPTEQKSFNGYIWTRMGTDTPTEGTVEAGVTKDIVYVYKPIEPEPEKLVNDQKDPVALAKAEDSFVYKVRSVIPGGVSRVVVTDTLEDVLEVVGTPECTIGGATVQVNGQTVTATIEDASAYAGQTLTLMFTAQIKDGVTKEQLVAKYGEGMEIPNEATFAFDDNPATTNEVKVVPPINFEEINRNPNTPNPQNPENPQNPGTSDGDNPGNPNTPNTPTTTTKTPTTTTTPSTTTSTVRGSTAKTGDDVAAAAGLLALAAAAGLAGAALSLRRRRNQA